MRKDFYCFMLSVSVHDLAALRKTAVARGQKDGLDEEQIAEFCGSEEEPDAYGCLRMLLDPGVSPDGCEIEDSTVDFERSEGDEEDGEEEADDACQHCGETAQDGSGTCITCGQPFSEES